MARSREARKNRRIRRLRVVLLVVLLVTVAAVVALFLRGRAERQRRPAVEEVGPTSLEASGEMVTVGEGFERTVTEGDRKILSVAGDRYAVDRDGLVHLEGVDVTIFQQQDEGDGDEEETFGIAAQEAVFDLEEKEGRMTGGVVVTGEDGFRLQTGQLELTRGGRLVTSRGRAVLRMGDSYRARGKRLRFFVPRRQVSLLGGAVVHTLPDAPAQMRLTARTVLFDRTRRLVQAKGNATLTRPGEKVRAQQLTVFLDEDERTPQYVRAQWGVGANLRAETVLGSDGGEGSAGGEGDGGAAGAEGDRVELLQLFAGDLAMLLADDGSSPVEIELDRGPGGRAQLWALGPEGVTRYLMMAPRIVGRFDGGDLRRAEAEGGVEVLEGVPEPPAIPDDEDAVAEGVATAEDGGEEAPGVDADTLIPASRRVTAAAAVAHFGDDGSARSVTFKGRVELSADQVRGTGEEAVFELAEDRLRLLGSPARATTTEGEMEAPQLLYTREQGILHGTGGVRARLAQAGGTALAGSPLSSPRSASGSGDTPVRVQAEEGFLRQAPQAFLFTGSVRAWRGENLVTADSLRGDDAERRLTASGDVRSLWVPEEGEAGGSSGSASSGSASSGSGEGAGGAAGGGPVEVTADEMVYHQDRRILVYTGNVSAVQDERTLACSELVLEQAPGADGGIDTMTCTGAVRLVDPVQGRTLKGHRAVYRPDARTFVMEAEEGKLVTMEDREGNVIEGPRMIYEIDLDRVRVLPLAGAGEPGSGSGTAAPGGDEGADGR